LVGIERQYHHHSAGVRTYAAVCLGACLFALVSTHIPGADPSRMAANIVVGIGFIGGGVILHHGEKTFGLTTAATLWVIAGIGTGVGFGMYILPTLSALITLGLLAAYRFLPGEESRKK
jgi:putative Mg2+ transporter-C (MgtC) family protein